MGNLYISSTLGSFADLPSNFDEIIEDSYNFYRSSELKELKDLAQKTGYALNYKSLEEGKILTFGKSWKIGYSGIYSGWFSHISNFINKEDFDTKKEEEKIQKSLEDFLSQLPEKYNWVKKLKWEEVGIYLNATN